MASRSESYGQRGERRIDRVLAALRRRQVAPHVPEGGVAVDLGCGHGGDLLVRLAPRLREGIGFDLSVGGAAPAPNVRLHESPADAALPLAEASADLVTCLAVLEHVQRPDVLLREARRVLRPGGALVVTTPSRQAKPFLELLALRLRAIDPTEITDHKRYYSPAALRAALVAAGFPAASIEIRRFELGLNLAAVAHAEDATAPGWGPGEVRRHTPERRLPFFIGLLVFAFLLLFQEGAITNSDGLAMYQVAESLVERGSITVDPNLGVQGRGGSYYSRYGVGLSAAAVAPYALAAPAARLSNHGERFTQAAVASLMPLIVALLAAAMFTLSRRLGAEAADATLVTLGIVGGTFLLPYGRDFFSEPLVALGLVVTIERLLAGRYMTAGACLGLAALVRPQVFLLAPALAVAILVRGGAGATMRSLAPMVVAAAISVAYNLARFADPWNFGYSGFGFTTPIAEGAIGLLFDPQKSVFLFAPIVLLVPPALLLLFRLNVLAGVILLGNFLAAFVLNATWVAWEGGWAWGPRLLLPGLVPLLAAIAPWIRSSRGRRLVAGGLIAVGFLVSAPTLLVSTRAQQLDTPPPATGPDIVRQARLVPEVVTFTARQMRSDDERRGENYRFVNLWQVGLIRTVGAPGLAVAVALSALLLALTIFAGRRVIRALHDA